MFNTVGLWQLDLSLAESHAAWRDKLWPRGYITWPSAYPGKDDESMSPVQEPDQATLEEPTDEIASLALADRVSDYTKSTSRQIWRVARPADTVRHVSQEHQANKPAEASAELMAPVLIESCLP